MCLYVHFVHVHVIESQDKCQADQDANPDSCASDVVSVFALVRCWYLHLDRTNSISKSHLTCP